MKPNPYQSPDAPGFVRLRERLSASCPLSRFELAVCCGLAAFLAAAITHRCQLPLIIDDATEMDIRAYTSSPLIAVEVVGVLGTLGIIPVLMLRSVYLVYRKRIVAGMAALVLCPISFGSLLFALWIDAPTLVYAT
jgi:hypothetical protein